MKNRLKSFILSLLSEDMEKQAFQVESLTFLVFILLLTVAFYFWQLQINITEVKDGKTIIQKTNLFNLLINKNSEE